MSHGPMSRAVPRSIPWRSILRLQGKGGRGCPPPAVRQSEIEHTGTRTRPLAKKKRESRASTPRRGGGGRGPGGGGRGGAEGAALAAGGRGRVPG